MIKIHVSKATHLSRAMGRVAEAFNQHTPPHFYFVGGEHAADVVVLHVIGWTGLEAVLDKLRKRGQKFAIMQYCLRSTEKPHTSHWLPVWKEALAVWSYYDLKEAMAEDGVEGEFNFYHAPLGVDPVFEAERSGDTYLAFATGYVAQSECLQEVADACGAVGKLMMHVGGKCVVGEHVQNAEGIQDRQYLDYLRQSKYVTGLRRCEGFELPAAEGLACGVRPVLFDAPHYSRWFGDLAEYIKEGPPELVTDQLIALFSGPYRAVDPKEKQMAIERFDWGTLIGGFYWRLS